MIGYSLIIFFVLLYTIQGNAFLSLSSSLLLSDIKSLKASLSSALKNTYRSTALKLQQSYILSDELKKTIESGPIGISILLLF